LTTVARSHINLEGHHEFDITWAHSEGPTERGFSAVVRVKNEARNLPWVLPHLFAAVERVILVDNASTDDTVDVSRRVAADQDASDRLEVLNYPFSVSRCGTEHLETPADSIHSLAYFYNWSFSHVRTQYALKWDGDMVLTDEGIDVLRDLAWQLEAVEAIVSMPRYPLYVVDDHLAFLDLGLINREPWGWPNRSGYDHGKALEWELPLWPAYVSAVSLPAWSCLELKHLDVDEFAHWSHNEFDQTDRTRRKRREWEVYHSLSDGGNPPQGVQRVESPPDIHVIEYVRRSSASDWELPWSG
jgi:glycosyltransferase involved in cell wall biosynthesis